MSTLVNGNTGTVFSDLRQQAHSYVSPEYYEDRLDVEEIAGIPLVVTDYALYPSKFDATSVPSWDILILLPSC